jgi:hypothetical protein
VVTALCALVLCAAPPPAPPPRRIFGWAPFADPRLEANQRRDGSIVVVQWLRKDGKRYDKPYRLLWPGGRVTCMAMSFDGKYLAAGLKDRVYVWDVPDGTFKYVIPFKNPRFVIFAEELGGLVIDSGDKLPNPRDVSNEEFMEAVDGATQTWSMKTGERVDGRRRK